jgi:hypothetical protein
MILVRKTFIYAPKIAVLVWRGRENRREHTNKYHREYAERKKRERRNHRTGNGEGKGKA